jgi:hypothetical protein
MAILKGPVNPVVTGITTFPELDNIQVASPNRHSVRPSLVLDFANSKTLDPRITFTRGSNATFYDGTSVIAEQNLLPHSQTTMGSSGQGMSPVNNTATAPDGTLTAVSVTVNSANDRHFFVTSRTNELAPPAGTTFTGSAYVKKNTADFVAVLISDNAVGGGARYGITINLNDGTVGGFSPNLGVMNPSFTVTSVGSGWYRVTLTITSTANSPGAGANMNFSPMPTNGSTYGNTDQYPVWTGNGTTSMFVWGWQMEKRSSASAYTATSGTAITNSVFALKTASPSQPRFEVDPFTEESKGLLIEEQRTNITLQSGSQDANVWTTAGATVARSYSMPAGGNVYKLSDTTAANTSHIALQGIVVTPGTWVSSVYAKAGEITSIALSFSNYASWAGTNGTEANFNLSNGTWAWADPAKPGTAAGIIPVGNGWYRCYIVGTTSSSQNTNQVIFLLKGGVTAYTGDGWSGAYIYGAQVEAGTFPTSYIPTTSAAATRPADTAVITGSNFSSWYNPAESTLYGEGYSITGSATISAGNAGLASIDDNTGENRVIIRRPTIPGGYGFNYRLVVNSVSIHDITPTNMPAWVDSTKHEMAFAFSGTSQEVVGDGTLGGLTSGAYSSFTAPTQMQIGFGSSTAYWNGHISKIAYYPKRLSNAEIQGLTAA